MWTGPVGGKVAFRDSHPISSDLSLARRSFLQLVAAGSVCGAADGAGASYVVGAGYSSDPYTAASRALQASGQFPANLAGRTVIIKPNLVTASVSTTGTTTDPQVVRAIVDLSIAAGATQILIVEAFPPSQSAYWSLLGYDVAFQNYPQVQLVDLRTGTYALTAVPRTGYAYSSMWVPSVVVQPNVFFVSAAKLKTHMDAVVTLSMKNLFGLGSETAYGSPGNLPRYDMHCRGVDLSIMDLNLVRPVNFAVIDGVWGMEGNGPIRGTPVATNVVLAGRNPVATDRVALEIMELQQVFVPHLAYATAAGLGPLNTTPITINGDTLVPYPFTPAVTPPVIWSPSATPNTISISSGQQSTIAYTVKPNSQTRVEIIQDSDTTPGVTLVRTLHDFIPIPSGKESVLWDGTTDAGVAASPGTYLARVQARAASTSTLVNYAVTAITATA